MSFFFLFNMFQHIIAQISHYRSMLKCWVSSAWQHATYTVKR